MRIRPVQMCLDVPLEVSFYALNGLAHTYASYIDHIMLLCFVVASGNSPEAGARTFHRHVRFKYKHEITYAAVTAKLVSTPHSKRWNDLNRRLEELLGQDESTRNLVSHNPVGVRLQSV